MQPCRIPPHAAGCRPTRRAWQRQTPGFEVQPSKGKRINLLEKFLTSDGVMVLYTRGKRAYRTMILLSSFQKEHTHVIAVDLAPAQAPHAP
jgi:hypothetical protein